MLWYISGCCYIGEQHEHGAAWTYDNPHTDHRVQVELPDDFLVGEEVEVVVTAVSSAEKKRQNIALALAMARRIAERGTLAKAILISSVCQREIRQDRPLPGRD